MLTLFALEGFWLVCADVLPLTVDVTVSVAAYPY